MENIEYKTCLEVSQFTESQVRALTVEDLQRLSHAQKLAFTEEQKSWMTPEQLAELQLV